MESRRIERLVHMITLLEGGHKKWTAGDLADYFAISERTFHRDRHILENIGVPLYYDPQKKTYNILNTYSFAPPEFTRDEAIALSLAARSYKSENLPYKKELDMALAKMLNSLPESIRDIINNLEDRLVTLNNPAVDLTEHQELIVDLEKAIEHDKRIMIEYNSLADNQKRKRKLDPYNLILKNGACYLVGFCYLRNAIRTFRIDRISHFKVFKETFVRPESYSANKYFRYSWGIERGRAFNVELVFKGVAARIVKEYEWHPSQSIKEIDDGKVFFRVKTGSLMEIKKWILSFGSEVKILSPEWLVDDIKKDLNEALTQYE